LDFKAQETSYLVKQRRQLSRVFIVLITGALFSLMHAAPVRACACCSSPGMRIESAEDLDKSQKDELARLHFDETAKLFTSPAFPEDIEGIVDLSEDSYELRVLIGSNRLTFEIYNNRGKQGAIVFPLPQRLVRFEVDPRHTEAKSAGGGPKLYKEWRLKSTVGLRGIVAVGSNEAQAILILHGHGNACTSAEDFTHWTLMIDGPGTRFTLIGRLDKGN
jgi:hypothetical protein